MSPNKVEIRSSSLSSLTIAAEAVIGSMQCNVGECSYKLQARGYMICMMLRHGQDPPEESLPRPSAAAELLMAKIRSNILLTCFCCCSMLFNCCCISVTALFVCGRVASMSSAILLALATGSSSPPAISFVRFRGELNDTRLPAGMVSSGFECIAVVGLEVGGFECSEWPKRWFSVPEENVGRCPKAFCKWDSLGGERTKSLASGLGSTVLDLLARGDMDNKDGGPGRSLVGSDSLRGCPVLLDSPGDAPMVTGIVLDRGNLSILGGGTEASVGDVVTT